MAPRARGDGGDELDELRAKLRQTGKWERKSAVEGLARLARLDRPEAWELVVGALGDPRGEVSDTAQWELGGLTDAKWIRRLTGRDGLAARDEWVRLRVAEALGRMQVEIDGAALVGGLRQKDPSLRGTLLWSLERLAREGRLGGRVEGKVLPAVEHAARRDRDPVVRAKALAAWVAIDARGAGGAVLAGLDDREAALRCASVGLLCDLDPPGRDGLAIRLADDPDRAVRTAAADVLGQIGTRATVAALARRLGEERETRLSWRLVAHLRRLSGLKHGRDPRPWRDWASTLPPDWRPAAVGGDPAPEGDPGGRYVRFAGLPILSERLCFLIDLSGSMWKERGEGRTRKDVVEEKLSACLEGFSESTEFNLIPFTAQPIPWEEHIVPATRRNVQRALSWFEDRDEHGTGNFWDAALLALSDPRIDTIVLLGDGEPTGGRRFHFGLLGPLFEQENLARRVALDSILVDTSGRTRRVWQEIAAASGGISIAVDL